MQVNGISMNVVDQREGPAVLLVHGFPDDHRLWRYQAPALLAAGYRVIAPDMRGYGESDAPHGTRAYAVAELVADLVGVLDALGVEHVKLVGHDWGAAQLLPSEHRTHLPTPAPPMTVPVLGVWSDGDRYLCERQMTDCAEWVPDFRYERVCGASHWLPLDAPDRVNRLLLDFFR